MAAPTLRTFTDAIIARLAGQGLTVGNHGAPTPDTDPPYVFVSLVSGGDVDGSTAAPSDHGYLIFQVSAVGTGPEQSMWLADQARAALVSWRPAVAGRSIMPVQLEAAAAGPFPDFDTTPPRFTTADRFGCWNYPA